MGPVGCCGGRATQDRHDRQGDQEPQIEIGLGVSVDGIHREKEWAKDQHRTKDATDNHRWNEGNRQPVMESQVLVPNVAVYEEAIGMVVPPIETKNEPDH